MNPMHQTDNIVTAWLQSLNQHLALPAPAGLPVNMAGESWPDAIRAYGQRYGSTQTQIDQAIDRAHALVVAGNSPASAIETVRRTLARWSQIRSDDDTFQARRPTLSRASRLWVSPA